MTVTVAATVTTYIVAAAVGASYLFFIQLFIHMFSCNIYNDTFSIRLYFHVGGLGLRPLGAYN